MTHEGLKKYLGFETDKLLEIWNSVKEGSFRTPFMLFIGYVEACYVAMGETPSKDLLSIANIINDDEENTDIYTLIVKTYLTMWNSVISGQLEVDLVKETCALNELLKHQQRPFL